jgi:oligoribonuclease
MTAGKRFIWTDIETTGLHARKDLILALGIIITDENMKELARAEWVAHYNKHDLSYALNGNDFVTAMHTKNGLLERVAASKLELCDVEELAGNFIDLHLSGVAASVKDRPPMAGNSVAFDREFIREDMPLLIERYNYRLLDVSSFKVLALATIPGAAEWNATRGEAAHTPLKDLEGSISELAHWVRELRR